VTATIESYFDGLVSALEKKLEEKKTARRLLVYETGKIGRKLFDDRYASAWTGVFVPFEIFQAMDVGAVFIEFVGAMLGSTGQAAAFLEGSERAGYTPDGCAYHRALMGAARAGIMGTPDILIGATAPCDGGLKTILNLSDMTGIEAFVLDIPPLPLEKDKISYLVGQYHAMMDYITRMTGTKADPERLREVAKASNRARSTIKELYEICKQAPAPVTSDTLKNFQIIFALLMGSEEGVEVANAFLGEAKAHAENGCAGLPEEKFRLMWVQNRIQYKNNLIDYLQENYGAKMVIDELNYIYWDDLDEDNPLEGLAVRQIMHPLNGPADNRLKILKNLAEEYGVQGAINPSHWGCRQNCGMRQLMKDELQGIGIPFINLDVDCVDDRNYFEGQLKTRLQGFMEMIEG